MCLKIHKRLLKINHLYFNSILLLCMHSDALIYSHWDEILVKTKYSDYFQELVAFHESCAIFIERAFCSQPLILLLEHISCPLNFNHYLFDVHLYMRMQGLHASTIVIQFWGEVILLALTIEWSHFKTRFGLCCLNRLSESIHALNSVKSIVTHLILVFLFIR